MRIYPKLFNGGITQDILAVFKSEFKQYKWDEIVKYINKKDHKTLITKYNIYIHEKLLNVWNKTIKSNELKKYIIIDKKETKQTVKQSLDEPKEPAKKKRKITHTPKQPIKQNDIFYISNTKKKDQNNHNNVISAVSVNTNQNHKRSEASINDAIDVMTYKIGSRTKLGPVCHSCKNVCYYIG